MDAVSITPRRAGIFSAIRAGGCERTQPIRVLAFFPGHEVTENPQW